VDHSVVSANSCLYSDCSTVLTTKFACGINSQNTSSCHLPAKPHNHSAFISIQPFVSLVFHLLLVFVDYLYLLCYNSQVIPINMHHLIFGVGSLVLSINLILVCLPLNHLIFLTSDHLFLTIHSSPSVTPSLFHARLKTHPFHKFFLP